MEQDKNHEQQNENKDNKEDNIFDKQRETEKIKENYNPDSLKLLIKFIDFLKVKGEQEIWTLFLMQERLIYTASYLMEKGVAVDKLNFDFKNEVMQFVQKTNLKVMEAGNNIKFEDAISLLSRPIDMLLYKPVYSKIDPFHKVLDLRILCFNNLSCIYRQNKQNKDALKAVDKAIQMEQILVSENYGESIKNIASTYINKAVIMSELGMHLESIETIKKALDSMEKYQKQFAENEGIQQDDSEAFQLKYLSVIAYFNLGVEHEHLFYVSYAKTFYEIALNIARELGYTEMTRTIENVLKKMKNSKQNNNQQNLSMNAN